MAMPSSTYPWATQTVEVPVINRAGQTVLVPNKKPPREEKTLYGEKPNKPLNMAEYNYMMNGAHLWFEYIKNMAQIGDTRPTTTVLSGLETVSQLSDRWGGTWESIGTTLIGSEMVEFFKKTA